MCIFLLDNDRADARMVLLYYDSRPIASMYKRTVMQTAATGGALLLLRQDHDKTLTSDVECRHKKGGDSFGIAPNIVD